jgi:diguanylate cyclase (GGDEF)-like protein
MKLEFEKLHSEFLQLTGLEKIKKQILIGDEYLKRNHHSNSLLSYLKAIEKLESSFPGKKKLLMETLKKAAEIYLFFTEDYDSALDLYYSVLDISKKILSKEYEIHSLVGIGYVNRTLKKYKIALDFFTKATKIATENDDALLIVPLNEIGNIHFFKENYERSLLFHHNALNIAKSINDNHKISFICHDIGSVFYKQKKYDDAMEYLNKALSIENKIGNKREAAISATLISDAFYEQGFIKEAKDYLKKAMKDAKESNASKELKIIYAKLTNIHENADDFKNALKYNKLLSNIKNDIMDWESNRRITELKIKYHLETKEKESMIYRLKNVELAEANKKLSEAYRKLERSSGTDTLTKISNRRDFNDKIASEIIRFKRSSKPFSVILSDIDDFKNVNDEHGHDCGDFVLLNIAQTIKIAIRDQDTVARWGGEEFIMLLPETNIEGARKLAENIRNEIATSIFRFNNINLNITMTFGVAEFSEPEDIKKCIKRADIALYKGKDKGKNCVC